MASAAVMNGLWGLIESMSLTQSNRKWLADKLVVRPTAKAEAYSKEDQEILDGFRQALREWKTGRMQTISDEEFVTEVRKKETAGYYD